MSNNSIESNYFDQVNASPIIFEVMVREKNPQQRLLHAPALLLVRDAIDRKIRSVDPSSGELTPHCLALPDSKSKTSSKIFDLIGVKNNANTVAQTIIERTIALKNQFEFISIAQLILLLTLNLVCVTFIMFAYVWID